jgi:hypothetical protein
VELRRKNRGKNTKRMKENAKKDKRVGREKD